MAGRCLKRSFWHVFMVSTLPSCPSAISSQHSSPARKAPLQHPSWGRDRVAVSSKKRSSSALDFKATTTMGPGRAP